MNTDELKKHMDDRMDRQDDQIEKLIKLVAPVVTKVAVLEKVQESTPKTNALWAAIGMLSGIILSLLVYISKIN